MPAAWRSIRSGPIIQGTPERPSSEAAFTPKQQMGFLLSGAVLTETIFSWPGIGLAMYQAISTRDIPLIQGGILILALAFVLINFAVDVLYSYFNPKIKL